MDSRLPLEKKRRIPARSQIAQQHEALRLSAAWRVARLRPAPKYRNPD